MTPDVWPRNPSSAIAVKQRATRLLNSSTEQGEPLRYTETTKFRGQHGKRRQYRVQPWSANAFLRGVSIDAALEFDPADDRQQNRPCERRNFGCNYFISVAQMHGDVGIQ